MGVLPAMSERGSYDPDTITLLRSVLDTAWESLSSEQRARTSKSHLAERMLKLAARGERDPARLRIRAIVEVVPDRPHAGETVCHCEQITPIRRT